MCFVLKKVNPDGLAEPDLEMDALERVRASSDGRLKREFPRARVEVEELRENPESATLFMSRHLGEVRLGIDLTATRDWAVECGAMVSTVAAYLTDNDVPISYIFGPFVWRSRPVQSRDFSRRKRLKIFDGSGLGTG